MQRIKCMRLQRNQLYWTVAQRTWAPTDPSLRTVQRFWVMLLSTREGSLQALGKQMEWSLRTSAQSWAELIWDSTAVLEDSVSGLHSPAGGAPSLGPSRSLVYFCWFRTKRKSQASHVLGYNISGRSSYLSTDNRLRQIVDLKTLNHGVLTFNNSGVWSFVGFQR